MKESTAFIGPLRSYYVFIKLLWDKFSPGNLENGIFQFTYSFNHSPILSNL